MAVVSVDPYDCELTRDDEGYRDYLVTWLIVTSDGDDDPSIVINAGSLPAIGTQYDLAQFNGSDVWAFCYPRTKVNRVSKEPADRKRWYLTQTFSTRPLTRCQTTTVDNPLLEPVKIRGSFQRAEAFAEEDRNGDPLLMSNGEKMRGVTKPDKRVGVSFTFNSTTNMLGLFLSAMNKLNSVTMWGLAVRQIELDSVQFEKLYHGVCTAYYRYELEFLAKESFDRRVLDEGTMELRPSGDPTNPKDYVRIKDGHGENVRSMLLDGAGNALTDVSTPYYHTKEIEDEYNFLLLGVPSTF